MAGTFILVTSKVDNEKRNSVVVEWTAGKVLPGECWERCYVLNSNFLLAAVREDFSMWGARKC